MEEYDYKLKTDNPAFIARTISALVQAIKDKMQPPESPESISFKHEVTEFKYLKEKCICTDPLISTTASLGLIELVKSNTIHISRTMSDIVAMIPLAKNYSGIIVSVTELLIMDLEAKFSSKEYESPFNLIAPQHPLISVLLQDPNVWEDVLNCIASKYYNVKDKAIVAHLNRLFKPLYLYVLCDPFLKLPQLCRTKFFNFLVTYEPWNLNLLLNIIGWLQISSNGALPYTSTVIIDLVKSPCARLNTDFQEFLLLWLTSVLYELCLNKQNIVEVVPCISNKIDELKLGCASVLLLMLANCIRIISAAHLEDLLILSLKLLKNNSVNVFASLSLKASLLNWSINPSFITERSAGLMQALYNCIQDNDNDDDEVETGMFKKNKYISLYQNTNQSVHLATELCALADSWRKSDDFILNWLLYIPLPHPHQPTIKFLQTFLLGIFLYEQSEKVALTSLDLLIKHAEGNKNLTSDILTLVLHRLSNPMASPKFQLRLLKALPKMGALKENLQLIISTLKAISRSSMVSRTLALGLFYELWLTESRCYPYLQSLLTEGGKVQDEEFNIVKARILKELCIKRPELYGTEIAVHLSKILNQCKNDSGLASALALEGLKYLCIKGVIDIVTAWDSLASTFNNEKRTVVIISFCDLMSEVPNLTMESTKYQQTVGEVVNKLWWYTTNCADLDIIESAYKSLSAFSLADLSAEFPDIYQGAQPKNEKVSVFTNYELIPGKWWLVVLQNGNRAAISHAADLIISLASKEVSEYGRGMYTVPANRREPHNYNMLPESSIIRAVTTYIKQQTREFNSDVDVMCLKILSHEYAKPLPPHDWCFLQELVHEPHFRSYCITLASKQVVLSGTARRFIENFIMAVTHSASNLEDVACVVRNLKHLCNSIQPSIMKPLIENSFRYALSFIENQGDCAFFDELTFQVKDVLKKEDLQEANRTVLAQIIVKNLQNSDESTPVFQKLLECMPLLPERYIKECISLMKQWPDGNFKIIKIYCSVAKHCTKSPLVWLNDVIDSIQVFETDLRHIWLEIIDVFITLKDHSKAPDCWILELIGQIQINLADLQVFKGRIAFMCDVLMLAVTVLSGHHVLLKTKQNLTEHKTIMFLFPQALRFLLMQDNWQNHVLQMLEWLYHLINLEIPEEYEVAFYQALVALRHQVAFKESLKWMKFVGCQRKHE